MTRAFRSECEKKCRRLCEKFPLYRLRISHELNGIVTNLQCRFIRSTSWLIAYGFGFRQFLVILLDEFLIPGRNFIFLRRPDIVLREQDLQRLAQF